MTNCNLSKEERQKNQVIHCFFVLPMVHYIVRVLNRDEESQTTKAITVNGIMNVDVKRVGSEAATRKLRGGIWSNEWIRRPDRITGECNTVCRGVDYNFARMLVIVNGYFTIRTVSQHYLLPEQMETLKNTIIEGIKDVIHNKMHTEHN